MSAGMKFRHPAATAMLAMATRMFETADAAEADPKVSDRALRRYRARAERLLERAQNFGPSDERRVTRALEKRQRKAERRLQHARPDEVVS